MNPSELIDKEIAETTDWRGEVYKKLRNLIHQADPDIQEGWKWNCAVFDHGGLVCSIAPFKQHVGMNFFKGASLADPGHLFNSGLEAKTSRMVKFEQGDKIPETRLIALVKAAVAFNNK